MVYHLLGQLQASRRHAELVKANALQAELSFLKAQINPHFLFNTLNNIYALTLKQSEDAPKAVLKLSNLMRQFTSDTAVEYVPMDEEVQFIQDYVALQQLRLSDKTSVNCNLTNSNQPLRIAPRLLIPFIDNAFKYGVSNRTKSSIDIDLRFNGSTLLFSVKNAIHANNAERQTSSGIGLENVKRRLNLLYEGHYTLTKQQTDTHFHVTLTLTLPP
jgi:LytS/YehU family sensor histidine kinase